MYGDLISGIRGGRYLPGWAYRCLEDVLSRTGDRQLRRVCVAIVTLGYAVFLYLCRCVALGFSGQALRGFEIISGIRYDKIAADNLWQVWGHVV